MEGRLYSRGNGFDACNGACYHSLKMVMTWMMMPWYAYALVVDARECVKIVACSGTRSAPL